MSSDTAFDDADLNGFVDGRIDPARAAALAESLASDPQARARIDAWKRQNESLRTMFASVLFEPLPVRLLPGAIPARPPSPAPAKRRDTDLRDPAPPKGRIAGAVVTTSLGMALVGFVLGGLASLGTDGFGLGDRVAAGWRHAAAERAAAPGSLGERAAQAHRTYLGDGARQVELTAAEEPKLLRWLQHRLSAPARIPDLGRLGWGFVGGRILPGPQGAEAFLVYGNGTERLGLTVSRAPATPAEPTVQRDAGEPIAVASWGDGAFSYALTSDRGADWLDRNGEALRSSIRAQMGLDPTGP